MHYMRADLVVAAKCRMRLWLVIIVGTLTLPVAGFADHRGDPHGNGGVNEFFDTPVDITFLDRVDDGIQSDNGSTYVDGVDSVEAAKSGRKSFLDILLDTGETGERTLFLDFNCIEMAPCDPPFAMDFVPAELQVLADGTLIEDEPDMDAVLRIDFLTEDEDTTTPWRLSFGPSVKGCEQRSPAIVTLTNTNPNTWTITADDPAAVACLKVRRKGGQFHGYYNMPVGITVVEKT
ncbi:MAG: hypothetical protein ABFS02_00515 [Pseudomonadota bacterium]